MLYYAVHCGHKKGIFMTWAEAEKCVKGYPGALHAKFKNIADAEHYVKTGQKRVSAFERKSKPKTVLARPAVRQAQAQAQVQVQVQVNPVKPAGTAKSTKAPTPMVPLLKTLPTKQSYLEQAQELKDEYYNHPHYRRNNTIHNIYADGSAFGNGKRNAVGGFGVFVPGTDYVGEYILSMPIKGKATNNIGELNGIIKSLEHILVAELEMSESTDEISWVINYDNEYAVDVITGRKRAQANLELVKTGKELLKMCREQHIDVTFNHVYSHTNAKDIHSIGNEVADRLAKARGKH